MAWHKVGASGGKRGKSPGNQVQQPTACARQSRSSSAIPFKGQSITILLILTVFLPTELEAQTAVRDDNVPQNITSIGEGWESILGQPALQCVQLKSGVKLPEWPHTLTPASAHRELISFSNSRDAIRSFTSSISASYSGLSAGGSATMTAINSGEFSSYKSFASLDSVIEFQPADIDPKDFELTDAAKAILRGPAWPVVFREVCGDTFVRGLVPGGRLSIRLSVSSTSTKSQSEAAQQLTAASSYASGSAEQTQKLSEVLSSHNIEYSYQADPPQLPSPGHDFKSSLDAWGSYNGYVASQTHPVIVRVIFADYFPLILDYQSRNQAEHPVLAPPIWVQAVSSEFDYVRDLLLFKADLTYMLSHPDQFVHQDASALSSIRGQVDRLIELSRFWATTCIGSQGKVCPQSATRTTIPAHPSRAPSEWVRINVVGQENVFGGIRKPTLIGSTYERAGAAEIAGQWIYRNHSSRWEVTSAHGSQLRIVNRATGATVGLWTADLPTQKHLPSIVGVPPGSDVFYDVWDDYWPDNDPYEVDPARGRVGEVFDPSLFVVGR